MDSIVSSALFNLLVGTGNVPTDEWWRILIGIIQCTPPVTLVPRFILSLRQLYEHDIQGRRRSNIDTGSSVLSAFDCIGVQGSAGAIKFMDAGRNESEEMQLVEGGIYGAASDD